MIADVYSGDLFMKTIESRSLSGLKRCASQLCNGMYKAVDKMVVTFDTSSKPATFYRFNKIYPNNTVIWGKWR